MIKENNSIMNIINSEFKNDFSKAVMYIEAVNREFTINCKDAELKVIQENGTNDDLLYLKEAAKVNFLDRLKNGVSKIGQSFKKFSSSLYNKIVKKGAKDEETIKQLNIIAKQNPQIGSKKIKVPDADKIFKAYDKARSNMKKLLVKAGTSKVTVDDIDKVISVLKKESSNIKEKNVTINEALNMLLSGNLSTSGIAENITKANSSIEEISKTQIATIDKLQQAVASQMADNTADESNKAPKSNVSESSIQALNVILEKYTLIEREFLASCVNLSSSTVIAIKNGIKGNVAVPVPAQESTNNIDLDNFTFTEKFSELYGRIINIYENDDMDVDNVSDGKNDTDGENSGDAGYDTTLIQNTKSESGPDIDDDPWTDVIDNDPDEDIDIDVECGNNCGGYGCATEGYSDKFAEIIAEIDKAGLASKASNESILSSLYGNLGSGKEVEDKGALKTESTFDMLLESINDLY